MHTTYITTALLAFTTLAPVLSAAIPGRTTHHGSVTYCSGPNACAPMTIKDDNCLTFGSPMKRLTFSAGLSCELYANPDCTHQFGSSQGKVGGVEGAFDVGTDARAKAHGVEGVGSFLC
ncbi:hypothetical protein B0A54_14626 [Friedmanniomyces endolithicus]|uniref:Uncharacterized protein n=1 Tax=Friedmanniomyces endolithicus TaxID=329885 RepID=A0A4V5N641_9PEZI|nr:hypothetical protein B0A54_14626 [Friedmanniomyces endolithicus]